MRNDRKDTIAAIATAQGEGGIAIVRISGASALQALDAVFARGKEKKRSEEQPAESIGTRTAGALDAVFMRGKEPKRSEEQPAESIGTRTAGALDAVFMRGKETKRSEEQPADLAGTRTAGALEDVFMRQPVIKHGSGEYDVPGEFRAAWQSNRLYYGHVMEEGRVVDEAMAVYMPSPRSYTREDVCEIHCHGGRYAAAKALALVLKAGVRAAEPGEFTLRAFLNGRIDLSQAEAVMEMIKAGSESAARAAARQMEGGLGRFVDEMSARLTGLLALIEAGVDFPEEVDEQATAKSLREGVLRMIAELSGACDERAARIVREGLTVAIAGAPNAGKSSLLNALTKSDRAIVTSVPGTTRDVLTERLRVRGLDITLLDTAGLRDAQDEIEREGVLRARRAMEHADVVLLVLDGSVPEGEAERALLKGADARYLVALNKRDLGAAPGRGGIPVSAKTGQGVEELLAALFERAGAFEAAEERLTAPRHLDLAKKAIEALKDALAGLDAGAPLDVLSVDLMAALSALLEIVGRNAPDEVISAVFRNFCVGK